MASDGRSCSNKKMTITFTLPISCQICLGKVKQPVLCPNLHVFCSLCLEIWLKRNSQCPACRVDIGPDNPVKHIIGGQVEDDERDKKSSAEIRRTRFDLLYQEYEDQIDQMKKENIVLTTENNILIAQLKEIEENNGVCKDKINGLSSGCGSSLQPADGPSLLMLTKKLQEAQKLYSTIKAHMSELKQENGKLKDENMHLTRENETLRLEIAQRSPKKFGRYTVATLETRIAEQDKEIRQLKKALECSDLFIEELQCKQRNMHDGEKNSQLKKQSSLVGKERFQTHLEPKLSADEDSLNINPPLKNKHCKVLFGKVVPNEDDITDVLPTNLKSRSLQNHQCVSVASSDVQKNVFLNNMDSHLTQSNSNVSAALFSKRSNNETTVPHQSEKEQGKKSQEVGNLPNEAAYKDALGLTLIKSGSNFTNKSGDSSSFDLEMPSPVSSSTNSNPHSPEDTESAAGPSGKLDLQSRRESKSKLSTNVHSTTSKKTVSFDNKLINPLQTPESLNEVAKIHGKAKKLKSSKYVQNGAKDDENDSSLLSMPDIPMEEVIDNLSDSNDITDHEDDNPDASMSPELTYCLKMINQAEKNINFKKPSAPISTKPSFPLSLVSSASSILPNYQASYPNFTASSSIDIHNPSSMLQYFPAPTNPNEHKYTPTYSTSSSWVQQFYNSIKVNPFKNTPSIQSQHFPTSYNHLQSNSNTIEFGIPNKQEINHLPDFKFRNECATRQEFKFSDPLQVISTSVFSHPPDPVSNRSEFNPSSVKQNAPSSSLITPATFYGHSLASQTSKTNTNSSK